MMVLEQNTYALAISFLLTTTFFACLANRRGLAWAATIAGVAVMSLMAWRVLS